jgi:NAD(P)-dependent dehydrogenase (short-subunit alcohol dehydrogenase family)
MTSNSTFKPETGALEVAEAYSAQAAHKTVLVTGVSTESLGDFIVRAFAHGGASTIIITGRNPSRLASVSEKLAADYPSTRFRPLTLDLASLKSADTAAKELLSDDSIPQIDILIPCGGTHDLRPERTLTADGLESHFVVNYLSHYHLINKLLPKVRAAARKNPAGATRIVTVTSGASAVSPFRFSDYNFDLDGSARTLPADEKPNFEPIKGSLPYTDTEGYEHTAAYAQSKTADILLAVQLNKLLASDGVRAFSVDPGLVNTQSAAVIWNSMTEEQAKAVAKMGKIQSGDQGAATVVLAALESGLKPEDGVILRGLKVHGAPEWAVNSEKANKLWELSSSLVAEKLEV